MPNVLLTGASGLIGSYILQALVSSGYPVMALVRHPERLQIVNHVTAVACDLENITPEVAEQIMAFKPEVVVHTAWMGTENTERNRPELVVANLQSSVRLLEIATAAGCKQWIGFGSQAEYSPHIEADITEDAPAFPNTAYGIGKLACCHTLQALCAAPSIRFNWLRLYTCYGREYKPGYIIPYLIGCMRKGEMPVLHHPHAVWDCLHAKDAADAVVAQLAHPLIEGIYNLGYGKGISMGELALILAEELHFSGITELRASIAANTTPSTRRVANIARFQRAFGWAPKIDIRTGLRMCL